MHTLTILTQTSPRASLSSFLILIPFSLFILFFVFMLVLYDNAKNKKIEPMAYGFKWFLFISVLLGIIIFYFILKRIIGAILFGVIIGGLLPCIYFLPYIIAHSKKHTQETAILILNLLAGWTCIAWIIAIIWSFTKPKENIIVQQPKIESNEERIEKLYDMYKNGIITEEEFEIKKKELLGI